MFNNKISIDTLLKCVSIIYIYIYFTSKGFNRELDQIKP